MRYLTKGEQHLRHILLALKALITVISFDADLPIECDDEYWDTPEPAMFKQPKGKPSKLTAFTLIIRLNQILAACLKTIVSGISLEEDSRAD